MITPLRSATGRVSSAPRWLIDITPDSTGQRNEIAGAIGDRVCLCPAEGTNVPGRPDHPCGPGGKRRSAELILPTNCSASSGSPGVLHQDMKKYGIRLPEILQKAYLKNINCISEMILSLQLIKATRIKSE